MIWSSPRRLIFCALMGIALWVTNFSQAHALTPIAPALPSILAGFTTPFFLITSYLVTRRAFAITTTYLVFAAFATFNLVMGPPGIHKLVLALLSAGAYDLVLLFLKRRAEWRIYVGFVVYTLVSLITYVAAFQLLDLPGKDQLMKGLAAFASIFLIEGLISTWFATWFYKRWLLSNETVRVWKDQ